MTYNLLGNPEPNPDDMLRHLSLLYDWMNGTYGNAKFEVRCIHPHNENVRARRFECSEGGYVGAACFATEANRDGFNIYVTVNPLKRDTDSSGKDVHVEISSYHFTDSDGSDDHDVPRNNHRSDFTPAFRVITGSVPLPRLHTYWKMAVPVRCMETWRETQGDLAVAFQTDKTVVNPARILRLAGTVSYPDERKAARGYITELVRFELGEGQQIDPLVFASAFHSPMEPPGKASDVPSLADDAGNVPLHVIDAALAAIPPVSTEGSRNLWLDIGYTAKDANSAARPAFECWQRQSSLYDPKDARLWDSITPSPGSYVGLFRHAKLADPDWWRHDPAVAEWWRGRAAQRDQAAAPPRTLNAAEIIRDLAGRHAAGEQVAAEMCIARPGSDPADIRKVRDYATRVLKISATDINKCVQRKRVVEALGAAPETASEFVTMFVEQDGISCRYNGILLKNGSPRDDFGYNELQRNIRVRADELHMAKIGIGHPQINDAADKWYIDTQRARKQHILEAIRWHGDEGMRRSAHDAMLNLVGKCFECPDGPEFVAAVFLKFIHQVKRKIAGMTVYNHLMPVIMNPKQGIGKTTFVERLTSPVEEVSIPVDFRQITDERNIAMWRNFVMYLEEMGWASKADIESVKHTISASTLTRRPMRTNHTEEVRQNATFIGTANAMAVSDLFRDPTGMRRFIGIIMCDEPDWNAINEMDWPNLWRSVDPCAADPIQPYEHLLIDRQEKDREKAPVEVWQELIDSQVFLGGAIKARRVFSREELFADFHSWEVDHFPRSDTTLTKFSRELGRIAKQFPRAAKFVADRDADERGWKWIGEVSNVRRMYA